MKHVPRVSNDAWSFSSESIWKTLPESEAGFLNLKLKE